MDFHFTAKASLFCAFIIVNSSFSNKISLPDFYELNSKKLNECSRCKVVVDSFNHWLDVTSRGKFEGGDTAWEEAKLKSYARSEVRLVEIQEGMCSELKKHQDACYGLFEEVEQALEQWWFENDPHSIDLFTWLCIENLQYCCPQQHFGNSCEHCPLDENNKICGGHGRCDGEGTRKGNGSCICHKGYAGEFCQDCGINFYSLGSNQCQPCHESCNGCSGEGEAACFACKPGWQLEAGVCTDVNECSDPNVCKPNQYCINKDGSHSCKLCDKSCRTCTGPGVTACKSCTRNFVLWSGVCVDDRMKDEILTDTVKRLALYCGLIFMAIFIHTISRSLASLIMVVIASYIYFSEKTSTMSIIDIISNLYF